MLAIAPASRPLSATSTCSPRLGRALQRPAPARPHHAPLLAVRASHRSKEEVSVQQGQEGPSASDFAALAQQLATSLGSELADPATLDKLSRWLTSSHDEGDAKGASKGEGEGEGVSEAKRLLKTAAESYGVPTTLGQAVETAKQWLTGGSSSSGSGGGGTSSSSSDGYTQLASRLLRRLLDAYAAEQGQEFEGRRKSQYDQLYRLARGVLGATMSKRLLTRLVRAYLGI